MSTTTPNYGLSEYSPASGIGGLIPSQSLAKGATVLATLDLTGSTGAYGAWIRIRIGRLGTTAPGTAPTVFYRPITSNNRQPITAQLSCNTGTPSSTTCATSDSNSGQNVLTVSSVSGFAAGDTIIIGAGTAREEYATVSKISGSTLVLLGNLLYTHTAAGADAVTNKADVFPDIYLQGGKKYEVGVDYGAAATGSSLQVVVDSPSFNSLTTA